MYLGEPKPLRLVGPGDEPEPVVSVHPSGGFVFARGDAYHLAQLFKQEHYKLGLVNVMGVWRAAQANHVWEMLFEETLNSHVYTWASKQFWVGRQGPVRITVNATLVRDVVHALRASSGADGIQSFDGIPLSDGKLDVLTGAVTPFALSDFVTWTLPFDSTALRAEGEPTLWLDFLKQGFSEQDISIVQEYFGYCLSGSTKYQKSLWIYGDPGCGKSVIFKVLIGIVGKERVAIRKSENFRSNFNGDLLGKRLVYLPDYRHDPSSAKAALDFLLTVAGDDPIQIERKYKEAVFEMLMAKIVWSSNNMPAFPDSTGASLRRFLVTHRHSTPGQVEDPELTDKLLADSARILRWAVEGARRLHERGRFDTAHLDSRLMRYAARTMNATYAFLEDACFIGEAHAETRTDKQAVFDAWKIYAQEAGHYQRYTRETFAASLMQSAKQLKCSIKGDGDDFVGIGVRSRYLLP